MVNLSTVVRSCNHDRKIRRILFSSLHSMNQTEKFAGPVWDFKRKQWVSSYSFSGELQQIIIPPLDKKDDNQELLILHAMHIELNQVIRRVMRVKVGESLFTGFMITKNIGITSGRFKTTSYTRLEDIPISFTFLAKADGNSGRH